MTDDRPADEESAPAGEGPPGEAPPPSGFGLPGDLPARLTRLERKLVDPGLDAARSLGDHVLPAWRRVTTREPRVPVTIAIAVAIGLMAVLPARVANRPRWLVPALAGLLLIGILVANNRIVDWRSRALRVASLVLIALLSIGTAASAVRLVLDLVQARGIRDPAELLLTGAAIWLTNMIVFGLWYWEFDRGGPAARALAIKQYPDFLFPQMTSPELAPPDWEPQFVDYLYLSFTNATAFSPTDVMPMSQWTKLTMLAQSIVSLVIVVLVVARAVNILQ
jgi:uncharacterized membrane protein